jgi:hypothetical protein
MDERTRDLKARLPDNKTLETAPRVEMGRIVRFVESGEVLSAHVAGRNADDTINLLVIAHDATTFPRRGVKMLSLIPEEVRNDERDPSHSALRTLCEQRWFWPPRGA